MYNRVFTISRVTIKMETLKLARSFLYRNKKEPNKLTISFLYQNRKYKLSVLVTTRASVVSSHTTNKTPVE